MCIAVTSDETALRDHADGEVHELQREERPRDRLEAVRIRDNEWDSRRSTVSTMVRSRVSTR